MWQAKAIFPILSKNAVIIIGADHTSSTSSLRPDIGIRILPTDSNQDEHATPDHPIIRSPYDFTRDDLIIELKHKTSDDPFVDNLSRLTVENDSDAGLENRGQLAHYAHEQFAQQHRCHMFQVIVFGCLARFLYWDRSGAIVTERFNYVEAPGHLATFLWRFSRTTDCARGLDPTVSPATEDETALFRKVLGDFIRSSKVAQCDELPWAYITLDEGYPVYVVQVQDHDSYRAFLVSRAFYVSLGPCGRSTRSFLTCDPREQRLYVIKDTWKVDDPSCLDEWSTYRTLERESTPSLLPRICGGDVLVRGCRQLTKVQDLSREPLPWRAPCSSFLRTHIHSRLVQEVGFPIQCLRNSRELVQVFYDVVLCKCALLVFYLRFSLQIPLGVANAEKIGVLHRDISVGNILFTRSEEGVRGILNDWDHAQKIVQDPESQAPFRSVCLLCMFLSSG